MLVDTRGLRKEIEGKLLQVTFSDGEIAKIRIVCLMVYDCHKDCNGFVYDVIETNQPGKYGRPPAESAFWGDFQNIESWETLGE
jgi:hypothetical protein